MHRRISESIGQRGTPRTVRANRILGIASKMFSLTLVPMAGETRPWRDAAMGNPCKGIERNPEEGRERFYSQAELAAIGDALDQYGSQLKSGRPCSSISMGRFVNGIRGAMGAEPSSCWIPGISPRRRRSWRTFRWPRKMLLTTSISQSVHFSRSACSWPIPSASNKRETHISPGETSPWASSYSFSA